MQVTWAVHDCQCLKSSCIIVHPRNTCNSTKDVSNAAQEIPLLGMKCIYWALTHSPLTKSNEFIIQDSSLLYLVQLRGTGTTFLTQIMQILLTVSSARRVTTIVAHPGQEAPATLRQAACLPAPGTNAQQGLGRTWRQQPICRTTPQPSLSELCITTWHNKFNYVKHQLTSIT